MGDPWDTDRLAELVARKLRFVTQLRELTLRQPGLIAAEDMTTLLRIFTAKQKLLEEIQRLDVQMEPFRRQNPEDRVWRTPELRERCREDAERCRRFVEEIKLSEERDKNDLVERRDAVGRQLEESHAASDARNAYRPHADQGGFSLISES